MSLFRHDLFGGAVGWRSGDWTSSDDRVRGGKSQSYLDCNNHTAVFHGNLDIKTLGGAGFASQRTNHQLSSWDLSAADGILLRLGRGDGKRYTFTLKDEVLPKRPDGREQSTVSWEYDFAGKTDSVFFVPWSEFKPTYRGKPKSDARPLNLKQIETISFMMRSFFGKQEGPFSVEIVSVSATSEKAALNCEYERPRSSASASTTDYPEKGNYSAPKASWSDYFCGMFK